MNISQMQNSPKIQKQFCRVSEWMGRQAYPRTALESTELFFLVFWDSSAFGKYSLWNYWICWDSSRLGIHFDRKPLFYTMNSIGMHTCLMKMYGFLKEFIDFQWQVYNSLCKTNVFYQKVYQTYNCPNKPNNSIVNISQM